MRSISFNIKKVFIKSGFLFFFSCLFGCSGSLTREILDVNEMKVIMWDMMKADELYSLQQVKDSSLRFQKKNLDYYEIVFSNHSINRETFYKAYAYYEAHPLKMKELIDTLDQYGVRERNRLFLKYGQGSGSTNAPVSADSAIKH
ncbi:MAG: DUF4296 domain-containing protein [Chitinophagia bacterium]|nr:DUF4296 domain-containing protein [Chitinophagia bacterium]